MTKHNEKNLYCLKQRIATSKNRRFFFPKKSGLCGSCAVLCCATGGNKNERNKRTMAWKYRATRGQQNEHKRNEYRREKAMAPHSSTVARKIPWMEEPGGLQSMGSHRSDLAAAAY